MKTALDHDVITDLDAQNNPIIARVSIRFDVQPSDSFGDTPARARDIEFSINGEACGEQDWEARERWCEQHGCNYESNVVARANDEAERVEHATIVAPARTAPGYDELLIELDENGLSKRATQLGAAIVARLTPEYSSQRHACNLLLFALRSDAVHLPAIVEFADRYRPTNVRFADQSIRVEAGEFTSVEAPDEQFGAELLADVFSELERISGGNL